MADNPIIFFVITAIVAFMIGLAKGRLGGTLVALAVLLITN